MMLKFSLWLRASPIDALYLFFGEKNTTIHTTTDPLNTQLFQFFFEIATVILFI